MTTNKKVYSLEFKLQAVELSYQRGAVKSVAEELGISFHNLQRWRYEYTQGKLSTGFKSEKTKEEQEIIRLKKLLQEAQLERDILKKAVSIFSMSDR